ncbi:nucleotide sugar dehydrogenase [Labrys okinawensis]|uniref:nucleotide sugar dehydrogenase n=1 Tax=Labrys okinawensis TaxID=346911 RepID=UPI0039BC463B
MKTSVSAQDRPVVGFAGMTHLGIVSAASVAARGFRTVCYSPDTELIGGLTKGQLPVIEPGLDDLLAENTERLVFSSDLGSLAVCDLVYIATDVPTDDAGRSDLGPIRALIEGVVGALKPDALLVILCQVPPGFTRAIGSVAPGRLYYQVETLVFGRAVARAMHPERTIIGCADPSAPIDARFNALLAAFGCPLLPMRYESAELAKIAINCCLVSSISVANTLSELCEAIGADWSEIVPALKLDARIGSQAYLAPGLGIAGGNLERDLATVMQLSERHGTNSDVVRAWLTNSGHRRDWAAAEIRRVLLSRKLGATVAVWGLAYKENTHSTKNSPSLATLSRLPDTRFVVHDPVVPASAAAHPHATGVDDPLQALPGADALMIMTPWPQYGAISPADIAKALSGRIVLDPYGVLDRRKARTAGLDYYSLGLPHEPIAGSN